MRHIFLLLIFCFCSIYTFAQAINDDCTGAIPVEVGESTTDFFGNLLKGDEECQNVEGFYDMWYSFIGNDSIININGLYIDPYFTRHKLSIFGGSCEELNCLPFTEWSRLLFCRNNKR